MGFIFLILGIIFIIIGIAGLILPLIPGLVFLVLGFYLITFNDPHASQKIRHHLREMPTFLDLFNTFDVRMRSFLKRKP